MGYPLLCDLLVRLKIINVLIFYIVDRVYINNEIGYYRVKESHAGKFLGRRRD